MKNKIISHAISTSRIILISSLTIFTLYTVQAWVSPTVSAPNGNVEGPLTTSDVTQVKSGSLGLTGALSIGNNLIVNGKVNVVGGVNVSGTIQVGNDVANVCATTNAGIIRYTGVDFEGCVNGVWKTLTTTAAPAQSPLLVNGQHTEAQCVAGGGTVINPGTSNNFCKFVGGTNPVGWTRYQSWSVTTAGKCGPDCAGQGCTTASHSWGNVATESCTYYGYTKVNTKCNSIGAVLCSATITYVGMY